MRNIYRIPPRARITAARVCAVVGALLVGGVALRTHDADVLTQAVAVPITRAVAAESPAPTQYFPAQYELHAGAPEPHIEAF
jgi:hypothetical protein